MGKTTLLLETHEDLSRLFMSVQNKNTESMYIIAVVRIHLLSLLQSGYQKQ